MEGIVDNFLSWVSTDATPGSVEWEANTKTTEMTKHLIEPTTENTPGYQPTESEWNCLGGI